MAETNSNAALFAALSKAQGQINPAKKTSKNPYFKSNYADLAEVWRAAKEPLSSNGLSVIQTFDSDNGVMYLITTLCHESGATFSSRLAIPLTKTDPQTLGSAITYCRRYALMAILGMPAEDDDGEDAMSRINDEQKESLKSAINGNKALSDRLLKMFAIKNWSDLTQDKFDACLELVVKSQEVSHG